jgi:hypothetical protein
MQFWLRREADRAVSTTVHEAGGPTWCTLGANGQSHDGFVATSRAATTPLAQSVGPLGLVACVNGRPIGR